MVHTLYSMRKSGPPWCGSQAVSQWWLLFLSRVNRKFITLTMCDLLMEYEKWIFHLQEHTNGCILYSVVSNIATNHHLDRRTLQIVWARCLEKQQREKLLEKGSDKRKKGRRRRSRRRSRRNGIGAVDCRGGEKNYSNLTWKTLELPFNYRRVGRFSLSLPDDLTVLVCFWSYCTDL